MYTRRYESLIKLLLNSVFFGILEFLLTFSLVEFFLFLYFQNLIKPHFYSAYISLWNSLISSNLIGKRSMMEGVRWRNSLTSAYKSRKFRGQLVMPLRRQIAIWLYIKYTTIREQLCTSCIGLLDKRTLNKAIACIESFANIRT